MLRLASLLAVMTLLIAGCTDSDTTPTPTTSSPTGADETTTTRAGEPTTTASSAATQPPATATSTTTSTTFADTTTTGVNGTGVSYVCPDLYRIDETSEVDDVHLAGWTAQGETTWEMGIGDVLPAWAVHDGQVILGLPAGELVGLDVATCGGWSITVPDGIADLAVTADGIILAINGGTISAFDSLGAGVWRHQAIDSVYQFAGENAGVAVFVDQFSDATGFDTSGEVIFTWGGASGPAAVAVSETFVYRATGAEVAARPVGGGGEVWVTELAEVEALFAVPGTLLAQDNASVHALDPQTGEVRWSIPFEGEIAAPVVLDHGELHLAARQNSIGFDTLWHLDPADGSTIFQGAAPTGTEWFPELDDGLLVQVGEDGRVTAIDLRQQELWTVDTGANRLGRFTAVELAPGGFVTLTHSGERF